MHNEREASSSSSIAPPPPLPSWADLPAEITANILLRLETIEILESAQRVCTSWWKVCHDPAMWRVVDLKYNIFSSIRDRVLEKICKIAVDRSQGQLLKISIVNFGSTDLLNYIAQRGAIYGSPNCQVLLRWRCGCSCQELTIVGRRFRFTGVLVSLKMIHKLLVVLALCSSHLYCMQIHLVK